MYKKGVITFSLSINTVSLHGISSLRVVNNWLNSNENLLLQICSKVILYVCIYRVCQLNKSITFQNMLGAMPVTNEYYQISIHKHNFHIYRKNWN